MHGQIAYKIIVYLQGTKINQEDKSVITKFFSKAKESTLMFIIPLLENDSEFEKNFIEHLKNRKIEETEDIEKQVISLIKK